MSLKRVDSSAHFQTKWERALYQHLQNKEKFSKARDKVIQWVGAYLPILKKHFIQGDGVSTFQLSPKKEEGIKASLIPIFIQCIEEIWGVECVYNEKNGALHFFLKEPCLPGSSNAFSLKELKKDWGELFFRMRKAGELIDFTVHCIDGQGKIIKSFGIHKALIFPLSLSLMKDNADEVRLDIETGIFSIDLVKYLIKRIYLQSPPPLASLDKLTRYLHLVDHLQLEEEKKGCEGMMIKWFERSLKQKNRSHLLSEMEDLATRYALPCLKSAWAWLTIFDPAKLLCASKWQEHLLSELEKNSPSLHPIAKEAKFVKLKEQIIRFATSCFAVLKRGYSGLYPVTLSTRIKSKYAPAFSHLAKEAWNLDCIYDSLFRTISFQANTDYRPYPSFNSEEVELTSLFEKLDLNVQNSLWGYSLKSLKDLISFIEESGFKLGRARCEEMLIETFETLFLSAIEQGDEQKRALLLQEMEELSEKNKLPALEVKRKWLMALSISKSAKLSSQHKIRKIE